MSNESEIYLIKTKDGESFEYNNKKSFCKAFKKLSRKKVLQTNIKYANGSESPLYLIRNKAVFNDNNGETLCFDIRNGKIFKKNKYNIIKDKNGNDKYIVKKDENNYFRYSATNSELIDSIEKKHNSYTYSAYNHTKKTKTDVKINSKESIDEVIGLTRKTKTERFHLQDEYKLEEQFLKHFNIRVDGNKLAPTLTNRFFNSQTPLIRQLCEDDGIQLKEEKNYNYLKLIELLCENKNIPQDKPSQLSYVFDRLIDKYKYKVYTLSELMEREQEILDPNQIKEKISVEIVPFNENNKEIENAISSIETVKLFDKTNELGIDDKTGKITVGGKILDEEYEHRFYFVKPVGQSMKVFKKEREDFSNHDNFSDTKDNPKREVEAAGSITIQNGKITNISNSSGHFKPPKESIKSALAYIASLTKNCKIENLIHPSKKIDGGYNIISDINDALELSKQNGTQWHKLIEEVAKPLTRSDIVEINTKAARMRSKNHVIA